MSAQADVCEFRVVSRDGAIHWLRQHNQPVWDAEQQRVVRIYGAAQDITERKQAEEAYRTLVEQSLQGLVIFQEQRIIFANPAMAVISGYQIEELLALSPQSIVMTLHPDDRARALQNLHKRLRGEPAPTHQEYRLIRKDGTLCWVDTSAARIEYQGQPASQVSYIDITERKQAELALRESEARFRLIAEHIDEVFWLSAPNDETILYINPAYERLYGRTCASLYADAASFLETIHPDDCERVSVVASQQEKDEVDVEYRVVWPDGTIRWVWSQTWPVRNEAGAVIHHVGVAKDVTERKAYQEQIERLAYTDALTGLPNRRCLYSLGDAALAGANGTLGKASLLYLDLNRFKAINDTLGHDAGDSVLVQVAARLTTCIGPGETLARLGGDEFAVLLPSGDVTRAQTVAEQMLLQLAQPLDLYGQWVHIGGSIGIAVSNPDALTFTSLLMQADIAMYRAKSGGGGLQVYDPDLNVMLPDQLHLEADLRDALTHDGLTLYYQPIFDLDTGQMIGLETLVRWPHPSRGLLTPGIFLPLAEEIGLLGLLDQWVLQAALHQAAIWYAAGHAFHIAINLTAQSLQRPDLVAEVATMLTSSGVPAAHVIIELTEHTALRDLATTRRVLDGLKKLGLRIALDDFGTGYASLTHLRQLPVDVLKLDRAFAAGIGQEPRDETVVRALLDMGKGLQLTVIIEGVEHFDQVTWLRSAGCRYAQGYLLGRPMPPRHFFAGHLERLLVQAHGSH